MKTFLIILYLLVPVVSFSQKAKAKTVPDTCFTQQEIKDISFTLDSLFTVCDINDELIPEYKSLIEKQKEMIKLDSMQIEYQKQQTVLLRENINLYVEKERITNKWYNNKYLWLGMGFVGGVFIDRLFK
jgi:site-specific DNA-adenine methylase